MVIQETRIGRLGSTENQQAEEEEEEDDRELKNEEWNNKWVELGSVLEDELRCELCGIRGTTIRWHSGVK